MTEGRRPALRQRAFHAGVALVVLALTLGLLSGRDEPESDAHGLDTAGILLAALSSLPLVWRRRAPLAVFAVTATASSALHGLGYPPGPPLGATVALFFLALSGDDRRAGAWRNLAVVAGFLVIHLAAVGVGQRELPGPELLFGVAVWSAAWLAGERTRLRRARIAELEARAHRAEREAERERHLAAAEERTRIARDLHDSAGHAINVILVQAGAARMLQERDPEAARAALSAIEEVARDTIGEIDQLVGVLRENGAAGPDEVEPPPGLAALERLAQRHRASGLAVEVSVEGAPELVPAPVDRAAFRILQEALTNAARHGTGAARVAVAARERELELTVENPARPGRPGGGGHGLVGMRERVTLLGGSLEAGPVDGAFRVRAVLPYSEERT